MVKTNHWSGKGEKMSEEIRRVSPDSVRVPRGDSFDIGDEREFREVSDSKDLISQLVSNPKQLISSLGLTETQAENVAAIITAGSAGAAYKYLSRHIGSELAGAIGGFLGAYVAKRLIGK